VGGGVVRGGELQYVQTNSTQCEKHHDLS